MDPLLSPFDYQDATGATVTMGVLSMASGIVRAYCGWPISAEVGVTATLDSDGGFFAFLPSVYVTAVTSVVLNGTDQSGAPYPALVYLTDYDWRTNGRLTWLSDTYGWPVGGQILTVTYSSGYVTVPDEVQSVVMSVAERLAQSAAIQSQLVNVGGIQTNTTYAQAVTAGTGLSDAEKSVLSRHRLFLAA